MVEQIAEKEHGRRPDMRVMAPLTAPDVVGAAASHEVSIVESAKNGIFLNSEKILAHEQPPSLDGNIIFPSGTPIQLEPQVKTPDTIMAGVLGSIEEAKLTFPAPLGRVSSIFPEIEELMNRYNLKATKKRGRIELSEKQVLGLILRYRIEGISPRQLKALLNNGRG